MRIARSIALLIAFAFALGACEGIAQNGNEHAPSMDAGGEAARPAGPSEFVTIEQDGRLWVFFEGSPELAEFEAKGEPAKRVTRVKAGPHGETIMGPDLETLDAFMAANPPAARPEPEPVPEPAPEPRPAPAVEPTAATAEVTAATASAGPGTFEKPGYEAVLRDGRLWVFRAGSEEAASFRWGSEPAKHVTLVGAGPGGLTVRSPDKEVAQGYVCAREGFVTEIVDGRVWVFREGTEAYEEYRSAGEPAKNVTRPAAGPMNMTVRAPDVETIEEYLTAKPGFETRFVDGRLWVFRAGSSELTGFEAKGEPAKHVTRPRAGPRGLTLWGPDAETLTGYAICADGFETSVEGGRIWVFRTGSRELDSFRRMGEPAKHVTRVKAGPMGLTVRGPDAETIDAYLRAVTE